MKSYVIFGCGRFGTALAKTLYELGNEVMVIDESEERIRDIAPFVTYAAEADVTDETAMSNLGIGNCDVAIIAIGSEIEPSIMATLIAKNTGIKKVIAKAQNDKHALILKKIGADDVVFPEYDMGVRIAHMLATGNILNYIELSGDYSIYELVAYDEWQGKTLSELRLPNKYDINVIAVKRGDKIIITPKAGMEICNDDVLVIVGSVESINHLKA